MDATGRVVIEINCTHLSNININTENLSEGMYNVALQGDNESVSGRFLK